MFIFIELQRKQTTIIKEQTTITF